MIGVRQSDGWLVPGPSAFGMVVRKGEKERERERERQIGT